MTMKPVAATQSLMIPRKKGISDLSQQQLDYAFSLCLHEGQHWKDEISIQLSIEAAIDLMRRNGIPVETPEDLQCVLSDAISHFTATKAIFHIHDDERVMAVEAAGYRMGPAGDF